MWDDEFSGDDAEERSHLSENCVFFFPLLTIRGGVNSIVRNVPLWACTRALEVPGNVRFFASQPEKRIVVIALTHLLGPLI